MRNNIREMVRRWQVKSRVPAGHVAVYVGSSRRRYLVRATHLNHPKFKRLLAEAEDEFGFPAEGPLTIPCPESLFVEILSLVSHSPTQKRCCHAVFGFRLGQSGMPMLHHSWSA